MDFEPTKPFRKAPSLVRVVLSVIAAGMILGLAVWFLEAAPILR